jgi:hypothetical protein
LISNVETVEFFFSAVAFYSKSYYDSYLKKIEFWLNKVIQSYYIQAVAIEIVVIQTVAIQTVAIQTVAFHPIFIGKVRM